MSSAEIATSLSVAESLVRRIWHRSLARIRRICSRGAHPKTSARCPSTTTRLPLEIVEIIVAYLIYDTPSLLACSLTCSSWYIAVVPHLHQTLTILTTRSRTSEKFMWPKPLRHVHRLGLLPLVKKLRIREGHGFFHREFTPKRLSCCVLHQFFALKNVQELEIDRMDIPRFMPRIRRYFKNFLPTLRSLTLREPRGSNRQLLYFIGLFQHLEDLKLRYGFSQDPQQPADDPALIPLFAPPLRGRLTASASAASLLKDMVYLFGGIRFRRMDLYQVLGPQLWINACAETLETLRFYPTSELALLNFDLSRHKLLRTLEVPVWCLRGAFRSESPHIASNLLKHVLSTITSPVFFEIVVVYRDYDSRGVVPPEYSIRPPMSQADRATGTRHRLPEFEVLREIHKVRDFQLVLCADAPAGIGECMVWELEEGVATERDEREFDKFFPEPLVIHSPRNFRGDLRQGFRPGRQP